MSLLRSDCRDRLERELAIPVHVGHDVVARLDIPFEDSQRQGIRQQFLDRPLQRPRPECRIVAFLEESLSSCRRHFQRDLAVRQKIAQRLQLDVDDLRDLFFAEALEDDDVIDPVQELGLEMGCARPRECWFPTSRRRHSTS